MGLRPAKLHEKGGAGRSACQSERSSDFFRAFPSLALSLRRAVALVYALASAFLHTRTSFDDSHAFPNSSSTHRAPHRTSRNAAWGDRDRSLLLVAREVEFPGCAIPRGGKRLHRGPDSQFEALQRRHP